MSCSVECVYQKKKKKNSYGAKSVYLLKMNLFETKMFKSIERVYPTKLCYDAETVFVTKMSCRAENFYLTNMSNSTESSSYKNDLCC